MGNYFIVGGSSGIGKELVRKLEEQGDQVYASYCKNQVASRANVQYHHLDVMDQNIDLDFLPDNIDGMAYCPGSINLKAFHRFSEEDFIEDLKLQVLGAGKIIKAILPKMKKENGNSSIILFSTIAVQNGFPFHSQVAISKGAIEGLTKTLAAEFAPKIRVNAIAPSLTNTSLAGRFLNTEQKVETQASKNPLKKIGEATDIAEAAAFLLKPVSSWITGQIIPVDGGYSTLKI